MRLTCILQLLLPTLWASCVFLNLLSHAEEQLAFLREKDREIKSFVEQEKLAFEERQKSGTPNGLEDNLQASTTFRQRSRSCYWTDVLPLLFQKRAGFMVHILSILTVSLSCC